MTRRFILLFIVSILCYTEASYTITSPWSSKKGFTNKSDYITGNLSPMPRAPQLINGSGHVIYRVYFGKSEYSIYTGKLNTPLNNRLSVFEFPRSMTTNKALQRNFYTKESVNSRNNIIKDVYIGTNAIYVENRTTIYYFDQDRWHTLTHKVPIDDIDNDGVPDKADRCIDVPGVAAYNGCPEKSTGELSIEILPKDAEITLNGEFKGSGKYHSNKIEPLTYVIILRKQGYATETHTISVKNGESLSLNYSLEKVKAVKEPREKKYKAPRIP